MIYFAFMSIFSAKHLENVFPKRRSDNNKITFSCSLSVPHSEMQCSNAYISLRKTEEW